MPQTFREAVARKVRHTIRRHRLTMEGAAFRCGISERALRRLCLGQSMRAETVELVSERLGITWEFR